MSTPHTESRCPVAEDGKHAWIDMEGLYADYCAHCGSSKPPAPQSDETVTGETP